MSLLCPIGPAPNILQPSAEFVHRLFLPQPILSLPDLHALKHTTHRGWKVNTQLAFNLCSKTVFFVKY